MKTGIAICLCLFSFPALAGWHYRTHRPVAPAKPTPPAAQPPMVDPVAYARYLDDLQRMEARAQAIHDAQVRAIVEADRKRPKEDPAVVDARVVQFLKERIADGSVDARYDLGVRYLEGRGVEKDQATARRLLTEAAERGHSDAKLRLAGLTED